MSVEVHPIRGLPEIGRSDDLAELLAPPLAELGVRDGDVVAVTQKVVSKAEGRVRRLDEVEPGERAVELAGRLGKDPRLVELVLAESRRIVRAERGVLIVETHGGWTCANAGIDAVVCGPGDIAQAHAADEYVGLDQIVACEQFVERLLAHGVPTTVRDTRGSEIDGACGQLAATV